MDDLVETQVFEQDIVDVGVEWVLRVCLKVLLIARQARGKQASLLETVEFETNGVG